MDVGLPALRVEAGLTFMARVCAPESLSFLPSWAHFRVDQRADLSL